MSIDEGGLIEDIAAIVTMRTACAVQAVYAPRRFRPRGRALRIETETSRASSPLGSPAL